MSKICLSGDEERQKKLTHLFFNMLKSDIQAAAAGPGAALWETRSASLPHHTRLSLM